MRYEVYHQEPYNPFIKGDKLLEMAQSWPLGYVCVAEVETDEGLEKVFELTNHIYGEWWLNPGVRRIGKATRSTSVGDTVLTPDGKLHLVMPFGFKLAMVGINDQNTRR